MRKILLLGALILAPVVVFACSSSDNTTTTTPTPDAAADTAMADDTSTGDTDSSVPDDAAEAAAPLRCSDAELAAGDMTGVAAGTPIVISFPTTSPPAQYTNNCITVKQGALINFIGSFSKHPLQTDGGDEPTPIPELTNTDQPANSLSVTMTTVGSFGYDCMIHPGVMFGDIKVVP